MASPDLRKELECSICWNIYKDPVTLSCGDTFCLDCVRCVLGTQDEYGVYTCPECKIQNPEYPKLTKNVRLCNMVQHFSPALPQPEKSEDENFCSYCVDICVPAAKICLDCKAFMCNDHLKTHATSEMHLFADPISWDGSRSCSIHKNNLNYYCFEDATCICATCRVTKEHLGHRMESLNQTLERIKSELRYSQVNMTSQIKEAEIRVQSLQEHQRKVKEKAAGERERVSTIYNEIREYLRLTEQNIQSEITRQEEQISLHITEQIHQLEIKKDDLSRKIHHIEELCIISDPMMVLEEYKLHNIDVCEALEGDKNIIVKESWNDSLIYVIVNKSLAGLVTDIKVKRDFYVMVSSDILLDENTVCKLFIPTGELKIISKPRQRYKLLKMLKKCLSDSMFFSSVSSLSGRYYLEVEISDSGNSIIALMYPKIEGERCPNRIGYNKKSWCLLVNNNSYTALHNSERIPLQTDASCQRFGIFLDFDAGCLSFYQLCDQVTHLHTFTTTFTEPLHVSFYVNDKAWVRIKS